MSPGSGPPQRTAVTYGVDIGGTKVLGVALSPSDDIVAEARVPTPTGTRAIVGSHVADAVAAVVRELDGAAPRAADPVTVRPRSAWARPAWSTATGDCVSRPTCPRPTASTGPS